MFLRRNRREVNGETYEYWTLVESYRTERGPRQRVMATLGKLGGLDQEERHGWEELEWLLEGQRPPRQLKLGSEEQTLGVSGPLWAEVDLSGVRVERVRDFGEVYLALSLWRRLGLDELLAGLIEAGSEAVEWEQVACLLTLARFSAQKSDPCAFWQWYIQLQQAEAAFRTGKSDLWLRPMFHQKTERVEAHILVCFLALALWRTLEMWMRGKGLGTCARQLLKEVATVRSMDVILPLKDRGEVRLRVVAKPDRPVAKLLHRLGVILPRAPKIVENVVEKITR